MTRRNAILLAAAALIAALPLFMPGTGADSFAGADERATALAQEIRPDYTPWAAAPWTPPSAEIESLLFMLQAGLGAGLLGYYLGLRRGEARGRERRAATDAGSHRRVVGSDDRG